MEQKRFLRLDIQFFSEEPPAPGVGDPNPADPQAQSPSPQSSNTKPEGGDQLNADEIKKMAESEFLKSLGVDNFDSLKKTIESHRKWEESQKTEQDKLNDKLKTFESQLSTKDQELTSLQAENAAIKAGITNEKNLEAVIALAKTRVSDDIDISAAIKSVVEDFPHFSESAADVKKPSFVQKKYEKQEPSDLEKWKAAFGVQ